MKTVVFGSSETVRRRVSASAKNARRADPPRRLAGPLGLLAQRPDFLDIYDPRLSVASNGADNVATARSPGTVRTPWAPASEIYEHEGRTRQRSCRPRRRSRPTGGASARTTDGITAGGRGGRRFTVRSDDGQRRHGGAAAERARLTMPRVVLPALPTTRAAILGKSLDVVVCRCAGCVEEGYAQRRVPG